MEQNVFPIRAATSTNDLRRVNREILIRLLAQRGEMSRGALASELGLTQAAISRITRELLDAGILREGEAIRTQGRTGRRETLISINPDGAFVLAITLTANRRVIALANAHGSVIELEDCEDLDTEDPAKFLRALATRAKALVFDADFHRSRLLGVGVSAAISSSPPGTGGSDLIMSNPLGWINVPVRAILAEALGLPVSVEHRASAILRAELKRADQNADTFLANVALAIGSSSYLGDRFIATGMRGLGSLSHLAMPGDPTPCACGRTGCMDVIASGRAIAAMLGKSDLPLPRQAMVLTDAVQAAKAGDTQAKHAFRTAGRNMAYGIDAAKAILNPEKIILSGEVGRQPDYFEALVETLDAAGAGEVAARLTQSAITSIEAAVSVALHNFVLTGSIDLSRLNAA